MNDTSSPRTGVVAGYASLFDIPDLIGDVVAPGAFAASLSRRGTHGIRMLFQHDPAQPIGIWTRMVETRRGLYVEGELTLGCARGRDLAALVADGAVDGLSIGFKATSSVRIQRSGGRRLTAIDLWEISIVTFPMLSAARLTKNPDLVCPPTQRLRDTDPVTPARPDSCPHSRPDARLADLATTIRAAVPQRVETSP